MTTRLRARAFLRGIYSSFAVSYTACRLKFKYPLVDFANSSFQKRGLASVVARLGGG